MTANELMICDLVLYKNKPIIVWEIDEYYNRINTEPDGYNAITCVDISDIKPIPLTAEILEKNGFIKQSFDGWMLRTENYSIMWRIDYGEPNLNIDSWSAYYGTFHKFGISFVHELQHALRLCNIEKEIDC